MLGDGTIDSWWRKVWPHGASRSKSPAKDALFIDVMADFSRKLGERVARQSAGGLAGAAQERREALKAYDRARRRQQILTAGGAGRARAAARRGGAGTPEAAARLRFQSRAGRRRRRAHDGRRRHELPAEQRPTADRRR